MYTHLRPVGVYFIWLLNPGNHNALQIANIAFDTNISNSIISLGMVTSTTVRTLLNVREFFYFKYSEEQSWLNAYKNI